MNKTIVLSIAILLSSIGAAAARTPPDSSATIFWQKFRSAVTKSDKDAVAGMSRFPIGMPYGVGSIRTKAQLIRRWREVFNSQTNAVKCFATARPQFEKDHPREFQIWCKDSGGAEVVSYHFALTRTGWKFDGLDNINE